MCCTQKYACVKKHGNDVHWKDPQIIPQCLSSRLKTFKFKSFNGFDCEVQFAKYIMQNSKVLQNMTIHTTLDIDLKHPMLETLSLCPMGSATCNLHFDLESAQHLRRPTALWGFLWFFLLWLWSQMQLWSLIYCNHFDTDHGCCMINLNLIADMHYFDSFCGSSLCWLLLLCKYPITIFDSFMDIDSYEFYIYVAFSF